MLKIISLCDNIINDKKCWAAEGASFLITINGINILFDTGRAIEVLKHNMEVKKIDISSIDYIILSHGHKGHMGAIVPLLNDLNPEATIVFGKGIENQKYKFINDKYMDSTNVDNSGALNIIMKYANYIEINGKKDITENVTLLNSIPICDKNLVSFSNKYMVIINDRHEIDLFQEEIAICIHYNYKLIIITGCAHRGINNIVSYAKSFYPDHTIYGVIGGFHLMNDMSKTNDIITYLKNVNPKIIAPCHCTGIYSRALLRKYLPENYMDFSTGKEIKFDGDI